MKKLIILGLVVFLSLSLFNVVCGKGYKIDDRNYAKEYALLWKYEAGIRSVSITPDGEHIVVGSDDRHIYLFNKKGEVLWKYKMDGSVNSVSITPDGEYVIAWSGYDSRSSIYIFTTPMRILNIIKNIKKTVFKIKLEYNIEEAESLLFQAEQAFNKGDYVKAKELAIKAKSLALDIDQDGVPNKEDFAPYINNYFIYVSGITISLISLYLGKKYYTYRKRKKEQLEREKREIIRELKKLIGEEDE